MALEDLKDGGMTLGPGPVGHASFRVLGTPPSLNVVGASQGWRQFSKHKKRLQADIEVWLMATRIPRNLSYVEAAAVLRFPTVRRRDRGNYQAMIDKSLGDALQNGGWLPDDTPEFYKFTAVEFDPEVGPPQTTFNLEFRQ